MLAKNKRVVKFNTKNLAWMDDGKYDETRAHLTDLKHPIIVVEYDKGKWVTLDGFHRTMKALTQNRDTIDAKIVTEVELKALRPTEVSTEGFFTIAEALAAAAHAKTAALTPHSEEHRASHECDVMGIDPRWSLPDRVARLQDIHQGSPLMHDERMRRKAFAERPMGAVLKQPGQVVSAPVDTEHQPYISTERFNSKNLFTL